MIFKNKVNLLCDSASVVLNGNNIDYVNETKYLNVILNSSMKTSSDVVRQTRKFYVQGNMFLCHFCHCINDEHVRYSSHFILICTVALFDFI